MAKVHVVVEMYNGLVDSVECYSTEKKAEKYIRKWIKDNGIPFHEKTDKFDIEEEVISKSTTVKLIEWLDDYLSEQHDREIHWFETEVK